MKIYGHYKPIFDYNDEIVKDCYDEDEIILEHEDTLSIEDWEKPLPRNTSKILAEIQERKRLSRLG